jgi:endonuclease-8
VVLRTATTEAVGFSVVMDLVRTEQEDRLVGHLGPDLLGPDWDADVALSRLLANPDVPIADALLDQRNLAGIGNVFKAELCFIGRVDPLTPVAATPDLPAMVAKAKQLLEANRDRPIRITTGDRRPGYRTWVYGRRGPCLRCGTPIARSDQGPRGQERVTYWCPTCQVPSIFRCVRRVRPLSKRVSRCLPRDTVPVTVAPETSLVARDGIRKSLDVSAWPVRPRSSRFAAW